MSVQVTLNGVAYSLPQAGENDWPSLLDFLRAIASDLLQKSGGAFTLTAEVDFGGTAGIKVLTLKSRATSPAQSGVIRLGEADGIAWRNEANTADVTLDKDNSNNVRSSTKLVTAFDIIAVYATDAGQSIGNAAYSIVNFEDAVLDTHAAVTVGASWKFTCPVGGDGKYLVSAAVNFNGLTAVASNLILSVFKNGADHARLHRFGGTPGAANGVGGAQIVSLAAGDFIDVRLYQDQGAARTLESGFAPANRVSICRLPGA